MINLDSFPEGCAGCGGLCCKSIHLASSVWNKKELENLPPDIKKEKEFRKKYKGTKTLGTCVYLTKDGLCEVQVNKPEGCSSFRVGNKACRSIRIRNGIR